MSTPKIEDKPTYCSAWVSKINDHVMCNTIPCCGFFIHGSCTKVTNGFMFSNDKNGKLVEDPEKLNKIGLHPLVNGKFIFNDGEIHNP